jgi:elongation factor G
LLGGFLVGYPASDVKATLVGGSYSETESNEVAYKIAASMAVKEAAKAGAPVLLEPLMLCEVTCPDEYMGTVIGDLNSRRGRILSMNPRQDVQVIRAEVPLAQMFGYSTALRSSSQGRATYTMEVAAYEVVPPATSREILIKNGVILA